MATPITKPTYETRYRINKSGQRIAYTVLVREPPIINSYDDAVVHDQFKGNQAEGVWIGGVYSGLGYETPVINQQYYFRIKPGYGTIYGRQFEIDSNYDIPFSALTGKKYCVVYVEINLRSVTKCFARIVMSYANAGYPDVETNDLIKNKQGIARMPLYRFIYTASGGNRFTSVSTLFYRYSAGVAEKVRVMLADGIWNGRVVSNLFYYNADRFKKANKAKYADLGKALGPTGKWVAYSDELEIKHDDESEQRQILCVTNNVFKVTGQDASDGVGNGKYLLEGKTYKFYYQGGGNPIPQDAQVIGIIVEGSIKLYYWYPFILFGNWNARWVGCDGNQFLTIQRPFNADGSKGKSEKHALYGGYLWENAGTTGSAAVNRGSRMVVGCCSQWKKNSGYGSYGSVIADRYKKHCHPGNTTYYDEQSNNKYFVMPYNAELSYFEFKDKDTNKPYIQVTVGDDVCIECNLSFRLLFIKGKELRGSDVINPFTDLHPQLEGGQT